MANLKNKVYVERKENKKNTKQTNKQETKGKFYLMLTGKPF